MSRIQDARNLSIKIRWLADRCTDKKVSDWNLSLPLANLIHFGDVLSITDDAYQDLKSLHLWLAERTSAHNRTLYKSVFGEALDSYASVPIT